MEQNHAKQSFSPLIIIGILIALGGMSYFINGLTQPIAQIPIDLNLNQLENGVPRFDNVAMPQDGYLVAERATYVLQENSWLVKFSNKNVGVGLLALFVGVAVLLRGIERSRATQPNPQWRWSAVALFVSALIPLLITIFVDSAVLGLYAPELKAEVREPLLLGLGFSALGAYLLWYRDKPRQHHNVDPVNATAASR